MLLKSAQIGIACTAAACLLLSGCHSIARATGDAYQGIGHVISDYGNGKYDDPQPDSSKSTGTPTPTAKKTPTKKKARPDAS